MGKAYSGFTDAELKQIDKFVRQNTLNRFGPVREVKRELVFEVAFDMRPQLKTPQKRSRHALSPHPPDSLGQAGA